MMFPDFDRKWWHRPVRYSGRPPVLFTGSTRKPPIPVGNHLTYVPPSKRDKTPSWIVYPVGLCGLALVLWVVAKEVLRR